MGNIFSLFGAPQARGEQVSKDLTDWAREIQTAGLLWVEAKFKADQMDEDCKPFLCSLKNALAEDGLSEAKIDRLAQGSKEYREYITGMVTARAEALRRRVKYDSLQMAFEAERSKFSLEKTKIEKGIFDRGN